MLGKMNRALKVAVAGFCALAGTSLAQESAPQEKPPVYDTSFVAIGTLSDAMWIGEGKNATVQARDPGASPPPNVYLVPSKEQKDAAVAKGMDEEATEREVPLAMNIPTNRIKISNPVCDLKLRQGNGEEISYSNFTSIRMPQKFGSYSVFMTRKPKKLDWKAPQVMVLSDETDSFPAGAARVINMADRVIAVQLNDKIIGTLKPGQHVVLKGVLSKDKQKRNSLSLWYMQGQSKEMALRRSLTYTDSQRLSIACSYVPKRGKEVSAQLILTPVSVN